VVEGLSHLILDDSLFKIVVQKRVNQLDIVRTERFHGLTASWGIGD
jgi:hypothetical protein